eukprot:PhM_4_TR15602/c0_g1_i1/m.13865
MGAYGSTCSCMSRRRQGNTRTVSWSELQDEMRVRPGDILLMSGTAVVSRMIKAGSLVVSGLNRKGLEYSHIAIVVGDGVMCEAIDNDDVRALDVEGEVRLKQVHIVPIESRIFARQGTRPLYDRVVVRRLHGFEWTPDRIGSLQHALAGLRGRPLNQTFRAFTNVLFDVGSGSQREITCCEVVAEIYKAVGLLSDNVNGRKLYPGSFAEKRHELRLQCGAFLGPEVMVDLQK